MTKNVMGQLEMIELADFLRRICRKDEDGFAVYDPDWTDARIVAESQGRLTIHNVTGLRKQLIGELAPRKPTTEKEIARLVMENHALRDRLARLENWAMHRPKAPFAVPEGA